MVTLPESPGKAGQGTEAAFEAYIGDAAGFGDQKIVGVLSPQIVKIAGHGHTGSFMK